MLKPSQLDKWKQVLEKVLVDVSVNEDGTLTLKDCTTLIEAINFLIKLQQAKEVFHDTEYPFVLEKIDISQMVAKSEAKSILLPGREKVTVRPKRKTFGRWAISGKNCRTKETG